MIMSPWPCRLTACEYGERPFVAWSMNVADFCQEEGHIRLLDDTEYTTVTDDALGAVVLLVVIVLIVHAEWQ